MKQSNARTCVTTTQTERRGRIPQVSTPFLAPTRTAKIPPVNPPATAQPFAIRSFRACDLPSCTQLYREGLLGGKIAENDTGLDIDDIDQAYMSHPGSHFWVAEIAPTNGGPGDVVGMIGVQHHEDNVGEIRRLRVRQDQRRRGIGAALVETALKFCRERGYLKIALDTFIE